MSSTTAAAERLDRKYRGGLANFAGNTFESHFAIWRLSLALEDFSRGSDSRVAIQLRNCHVDDWVEDTAGDRRYFQLKRSATIGWSTVRADFVAQLRKRTRRKVTVFLVLPSAQRAARLRAAKDRVVGARVLVFPKGLSPSQVFHQRPVAEALAALWPLPAVTPSDREFLWFAIDQAWQKSRKPGKFVTVSRVLDALPDHALDSFRQNWIEPPGWPAFEELLKGVRGLSCRVEHGLFTYSGSGISGRISCRNPALEELMSRVLKKCPTTLTDFMELL